MLRSKEQATSLEARTTFWSILRGSLRSHLSDCVRKMRWVRARAWRYGRACAIAFLTIIQAAQGFAQTDPAFRAFLDNLWPDARARGVSQKTFEAVTRGLTPDMSLPDLVIPGRPPPAAGEQAEFTQTPVQYLSERTLQNFAERGRGLLQQHRAVLASVEARFGVPAPVLLAIWARETSYGEAKLPHDVLRVLATLAFAGRRKERFREEFLIALKMVEDGKLTPARRRSSWAGAMGLVQFLPSDYERYGVDGDGNGQVDIWTSPADALASAASQLNAKGWRAGRRWAHEVRAPQNLDCTLADPGDKRRVSEWLRRGFAPAGPHAPTAADLAEDASLLLPAGNAGPAFLITRNYFVIKDYNFSDLYVLFVGNLSDRIAGGGAFATPWPALTQLRTRDIEELQQHLTRLGLYREAIDGKAGMATRLSLGRFQKARGLPPDCWPSAAALEHLRAAR
jgi:lytic murein transglycosylase